MTLNRNSIIQVVFFKKHIFLLCAIITLVLSLVLYLFSDKGALTATEAKYLAEVKAKAEEEIHISNHDLAIVKTMVSQTADTNFARLLSVSVKHPFYIFRNQRLVFWSDHHFVPVYAQVSGNYYIKPIEWEHGKYLANHRAVKVAEDIVEIFSIIPLFREYETDNASLKPTYNPDIFALDPQALSIQFSSKEAQNVKIREGNFLFSVEAPQPDKLKNQSIPDNLIFLGFLGIIFLTLYVIGLVYGLVKAKRYELGFILLAAYLIGLRAVMLFYSIPFVFYESDLFNPKFYGASDITPSLGDFLLNVLVIVALALYSVGYYFKSYFFKKIADGSVALRAVLSILMVAATYFVMYWVYRELNSIYENSQYSLDLTLSIDFWKPLKLTALIVYVLLSMSYFLITHQIAMLFDKFCKDAIPMAVLCFGLGTVLAVAIGYFLGINNAVIMIVNGLYLFILYLFKLPRFLYNFRYQTSIYFFVGAVFCAFVGTYVVNSQEIKKDVEFKQVFGKEYLSENDVMGEFLLSKASANIEKDTSIMNMLQTALLPREQIQQYVKRNYLNSHFDKYDVDISVFNQLGSSLDNLPGAENLATKLSRYQDQKYRTDYHNMFFLNEKKANFLKEYLSFVPLKDSAGTVQGTVLLDLKLRDIAAKSGVFSNLLTDSRLNSAIHPADYSYAIYQSNRLTFSSGNYNYEKKFPIGFLEMNDLYRQGISQNDYKHVGVMGKSGRKIVVSSEDIPLKTYSKFSFLFLVLVVYIIIIVLSYAVQYWLSEKNLNFATKIQIFLNVAFVLPLVLVVGITLSIISRTLSESQRKTYLSQADNIGANLYTHVQELASKSMSDGYFREELIRIANESGHDVSLFDTTGLLHSSNKDIFYAKGLLSNYLNPKALTHIVEEKEKEIILPETIGNLTYTNAYLGLKSGEGKLLGIVSVPFYDAITTFEKDVLAVIGSILNAFTTIFLVLLAISYFASNILTVPLRLITQRIKKTNLEKVNEPIEWKSDDEIGLLIGEFNRMLLKLEESKQALSMSEKQSAWREMAKQVAHEIKNPLTPMKLSLQLLQRKLSGDGVVDKELIGRSFGTMIEQIDNLSDIATSFSDFARMPVPKNELFDLVEVVKRSLDLYADDRNISLSGDIQPKTAYVSGDRQLMGRIITNLIINAIQSVPVTRKPQVRISLVENQESYTLECKDNGMGVPDGIKNKVFMMNFSTKNGGSGVGLAVAKRGIEHANGSIWFETKMDVGTTFFISLPMA